MRKVFIKFLVPVLFLFSCSKRNKIYDASTIFNENKYKVVEIQAETKDYSSTIGTGYFYEDYLITCLHVISYKFLDVLNFYEEIKFRYYDEEKYHQVTLNKYFEENDLALLNVDKVLVKDQFTKDNIAYDSSFGEKIFTISNLNGNGLSMEEGIVSIPKLIVKTDEYTKEVIQLDLTISSGSSGAPVFNNQNRFLGMISFRMKDDNSNIIYGISYALTSSSIVKFIEK